MAPYLQFMQRMEPGICRNLSPLGLKGIQFKLKNCKPNPIYFESTTCKSPGTAQPEEAQNR